MYALCAYPLQIYSLKPFEADVGSISPVESSTMTTTNATGDVIAAPGATSAILDERL